jgi:hypothetical protein
MADNKRGGLTNKEALKEIIKKLDDFIENIDSFLSSESKNCSFLKILNYIYISYLIILSISLIVKSKIYLDQNYNEIILYIPGVIIILVYFIKIICKVILRKKKFALNILKLKDEILHASK